VPLPARPASSPPLLASRLLRRASPPLLALVVLLLAWEALARGLQIPAYLLPPPSAIALAGAGEAPALLTAAFITARAALAGFALSAALGVLAAVVLASSRPLERALYPYTVFLQTVPIVAIAPLLVLWFGAGLRAVAMSAFIVSVFPVIANTLAGLRSVDPALRDLFRLYGARRAATLVKLELPSALPSVVTGLRVASGLAVIGAIVGEFVAGFAEGAAGLGILVLSSYRQLRTDLLFAAVLCASALGLGLFGAISLAGARLLRRWHPSEIHP
jgi:NitT/TauT family transport system permease protein